MHERLHLCGEFDEKINSKQFETCYNVSLNIFLLSDCHDCIAKNRQSCTEVNFPSSKSCQVK